MRNPQQATLQRTDHLTAIMKCPEGIPKLSSTIFLVSLNWDNQAMEDPDLDFSNWRMSLPRSIYSMWGDMWRQRRNTANLQASNSLSDATQFKAFYVKTITALLCTECKVHMSLRWHQLLQKKNSLKPSAHSKGFRGTYSCSFIGVLWEKSRIRTATERGHNTFSNKIFH